MDGIQYNIPKTITSDIGWQLMFGPMEDYKHENSIVKEHQETHNAKQYSKQDMKLWFL
jgi:hypothetical protein